MRHPGGIDDQDLRDILGYVLRDIGPANTEQNSRYLYISFRTNLFNRYYDL